MGTWQSFEEINAWKNARSLNIKVYQVVLSLRKKGEYELAKQIVRSAGSIMDNIAEGHERDGVKEFRQFISYSKGSAGELKSQMMRALDFELIEQDTYDIIVNEIEDELKILGGLQKYLNKSVYKGNKYK